MTNVKQIQNLKEKYIIESEKLKKEYRLQNSISVCIEYDYLLNTDVDWIIGEIRSSIVKWIKSKTNEDK